MNDWTVGYVADIGYTYGYYSELNPLRVKLAFLNAGLHYPEFGTACELGFGQGISVNIHAAASVTQWVATDFNPSQTAFAQEVAAAAGSDAKLFDEAFSDFTNRTDLPSFDYIGLHGIWSWISDDNRLMIVDFIKRKLKVNGVLYISYNTQPGWAAMVPMRDLLTEHIEVMGRSGIGIVSQINESLAYADKLISTNPSYIRANPQISERIAKIKNQNRNYLAHEYFNKDWLPMSFSKMGEWLSPAKLQFACSAHYLDNIDAINLSGDQLSLIQDTPDAMFRQTVRDFMVNQQFRKDYWVKGERKMNTIQQTEDIRVQRVMLVVLREDVILKVKGRLGDGNLSEDIYVPILDALDDHKVKTIAQLELAIKDHDITFNKLLQAIMILVGNETLATVQDDEIIAKAKIHTNKLNVKFMNLARGSGDVSFLASPVTGGGVAVGRFQQLFLLALSQGKKKPDEWAMFVWLLLTQQGQMIIKEGKKLESPEENITELKERAKVFAQKHLPLLKSLQII